jgi:hypothetical protein
MSSIAWGFRETGSWEARAAKQNALSTVLAEKA